MSSSDRSDVPSSPEGFTPSERLRLEVAILASELKPGRVLVLPRPR